MIGAWVASGGALWILPLLRSRVSITAAFAYLAVSLAIVIAARFPQLGNLLPASLSGFINDKTNLAPYRITHFLALALIVVRFLPEHWHGLRSPLLRPIIVCGKRSLEVFCVGVFLSFVGHFLIELVSDSIPFQILVSLAGIAVMTAVAYYRTWTKDLRSGSPSKRMSSA